jgi:hypothetical protein
MVPSLPLETEIYSAFQVSSRRYHESLQSYSYLYVLLHKNSFYYYPGTSTYFCQLVPFPLGFRNQNSICISVFLMLVM